MIARNLVKYAEAMALQMPLPFGRLRMLRQSRPTTRAGRAARAARKAIRAALLKVTVIYPAKPQRRALPCPVDPQPMFQARLCTGLDLILF